MPNMSILALKYKYWRHLPHFTSDGPIFVTFCKLTIKPFPPHVRTIILEHCRHDDGNTIDLHTAVVMPDHVHLLFTPRHNALGWTLSLPEIMRRIKGASARRVNQAMGTTGPVWLQESFDHVLRSHESLDAKIE